MLQEKKREDLCRENHDRTEKKLYKKYTRKTKMERPSMKEMFDALNKNGVGKRREI